MATPTKLQDGWHYELLGCNLDAGAWPAAIDSRTWTERRAHNGLPDCAQVRVEVRRLGRLAAVAHVGAVGTQDIA